MIPMKDFPEYFEGYKAAKEYAKEECPFLDTSDAYKEAMEGSDNEPHRYEEIHDPWQQGWRGFFQDFALGRVKLWD
jgi:hypothetical protein